MAQRSLPGFLLALVLSASLHAAPRLEFSPPEWKLGMILQGTVASEDLLVTNEEPVSLGVTLVPTCDCNTATPATQRIPSGGQAVFHLRYDSANDRGITTKSFLVRTDLPGAQPMYYFIRGTVREQAASTPGSGGWTRRDSGGTTASAIAPAGTGAIFVAYYYTPGCRTCEEFLSEEIPRLQKQLGRTIRVVRKDLLASGTYEELAVLASARGQTVTAVPALLAGDTLLQGDSTIREKLPSVLASMTGTAAGSGPGTGASGSSGGPAAYGLQPMFERLAVLPVVAAGLIDGINPCAFTTLIFLLASLALAGRGRNEVLIIGAVFSLAVFLSYFLIGLGLFSALRAASAVSIVSVLLRWILVTVLVIFAGLSVYDYALIRAGRPAEMILQLPSSLKKRIHASIRTRVRMAALAGSSLVLGFLVSLFEFACTGQVYLPMLGYLARMRRQFDALALLALYNLCFILPLLVVFAASWLGVTSGRITAAFQVHMGKVKLGLAVVFVGLAVLTLVG
jgi:cytochrome c biogenesis protein CcdA